jgi:hypothetical protein
MVPPGTDLKLRGPAFRLHRTAKSYLGGVRTITGKREGVNPELRIGGPSRRRVSGFFRPARRKSLFYRASRPRGRSSNPGPFRSRSPIRNSRGPLRQRNPRAPPQLIHFVEESQMNTHRAAAVINPLRRDFRTSIALAQRLFALTFRNNAKKTIPAMTVNDVEGSGTTIGLRRTTPAKPSVAL